MKYFNCMYGLLLSVSLSLGAADNSLPKVKVVEDSIQKLAFPVKKPEIPFSVKTIVGENPKERRFKPRLRQVHKLSKYLPPSQTNALLWYLHKVPRSRNVQSPMSKVEGQKKPDNANRKQPTEDWNCPLKLDEVNVIKNDISTALLTQHNELTEFPDHFIYMFHRKKVTSEMSKIENSGEKKALNSKASAPHYYHDQVWRDYCIQFLGQWMERWSSIESNKKIEETFKKALLEKGNSIAGTTLIACNNNLDRLSAKMQKYFNEMALKVATDKSYGETSRITAFQVCAMNGLKGALPTIREVAKGRYSACLRMSAISALGQLGDSSDLSIIKKASKSYDTRIRKAAYAALKRLNQ